MPDAANSTQAQRDPDEEGDYMAFEQLMADAAIKKVGLPQPIFSLFKRIGSTETLSRCSRAPPKRKILT